MKRGFKRDPSRRTKLSDEGATRAHRRATSDELGIKVQDAENAIERLKSSFENSQGDDSRNSPLLKQCEVWLDHARREHAEARKFWKPRARDAAYACLNKIRHNMCFLEHFDQLDRWVQEIQHDLSYVRNEQERNACRQALARIAGQLTLPEATAEADVEAVSEIAQRRALAIQSRLVAHQGEANWHKVNLIRERLIPKLTDLDLWPMLRDARFARSSA